MQTPTRMAIYANPPSPVLSNEFECTCKCQQHFIVKALELCEQHAKRKDKDGNDEKETWRK